MTSTSRLTLLSLHTNKYEIRFLPLDVPQIRDVSSFRATAHRVTTRAQFLVNRAPFGPALATNHVAPPRRAARGERSVSAGSVTANVRNRAYGVMKVRFATAASPSEELATLMSQAFASLEVVPHVPGPIAPATSFSFVAGNTPAGLMITDL